MNDPEEPRDLSIRRCYQTAAGWAPPPRIYSAGFQLIEHRSAPLALWELAGDQIRIGLNSITYAEIL